MHKPVVLDLMKYHLYFISDLSKYKSRTNHFTMSNIDWRHWEDFYQNFCQAFVLSLCEMRTDPDRFPRGKI